MRRESVPGLRRSQTAGLQTSSAMQTGRTQLSTHRPADNSTYLVAESEQKWSGWWQHAESELNCVPKLEKRRAAGPAQHVRPRATPAADVPTPVPAGRARACAARGLCAAPEHCGTDGRTRRANSFRNGAPTYEKRGATTIRTVPCDQALSSTGRGVVNARPPWWRRRRRRLTVATATSARPRQGLHTNASRCRGSSRQLM